MASTSASTTITFAIVQPDNVDGSNPSISVELDDVANNNKSTFQPGDTAHFLVHTNPAGLAVSIDTTVGTVSANGTKSVPVQDQLVFIQSTEETLNRIPNGAVSTAWIGRAGGTPTVSGSSVTLADVTNGILACSYETTAKAYRLSGVTIPAGLDEIQALIVVSPTI